MHTYNALNLWALNHLYEFGFGQDLKKVTLDSITRKPLKDQVGFNKNNWAGVYHIFEMNHIVYLYMHNEMENITNIASKDIDISLKEIMNFIEPVELNDLLAYSRKSALEDDKFLAETQRLEAFISKSLKRRNTKSDGIENVEINEESPDISLIPLANTVKLDNKIHVEQNLKDPLNKSQVKLSINEILISIECDDCLVKHVGGGLLETHSLLKYGSLNSYKLLADSNIQIYGHLKILKKGDILLPLNNKKNDQLAILKLNSNLYIENYEVVARDEQLNNCYLMGHGSYESDKWLFVAKDLPTALNIQHLTKVKVLVCETSDYPNDLLSDIHTKNPNVKLGYFVPEIKSITQKIKLGLLDTVGVYQIYMDSSSNIPTWNEFIEKKNNSGGSFQQFVKNAVKLESDRVKKLQS